MAEDDQEASKMVEHLKSLNMSSNEVNRFSKAFKDPKFKEMFMDYIKEISTSGNKEEIEKQINQCEQNLQGQNKSPMEDKEVLIPHADFCIKTHDKKSRMKVFVNICYCEKVKNCKSQEDVFGKGTQWEIPYSLGGPSNDKDKEGKECVVYDFIVGVKTHENTIDLKPFKQFLVLTAIESIKKQKNVELEKKYSTLVMKYKGKGGSKEPRIFTVKKEVSSQNLPDINNNANKLMKHTPIFDFQGKLNEKKINKKENGTTKESSTDKQTSCNLDVLCDLNVDEEEKDIIHLEKLWDAEIEPKYEVFYRNTIDYGSCWADSRVNQNNNTLPESVVINITLPNIIHVQDVIVDLDIDQMLLRVIGKYRLHIKLKYNVDKMRSKAQWKKKVHQLVITLPIESINSKT